MVASFSISTWFTAKFGLVLVLTILTGKNLYFAEFSTKIIEKQGWLLEYHFLVETTKIENTSFPFKIALSEATVKKNRMATTKWTYHKE